MGKLNIKTLFLPAVLSFACFGCSMIDSVKKSVTESNSQNNSKPAETNSTAEKSADVSAAPCANKYNPVRDGAVKTYKMSLGGKDARFVQEYTPDAAVFIEQFTVGGTTVTHNWECADGNLTAANPGSMLNSKDLQIEPRHISGVTLPKDSEIQIGKTWTTVYQATGKSPLGDVLTNVSLNNRVTAMDDEVKVPAGTFKAVKIETKMDIEMKMGGKNYPIPAIKSYVWFAPDIGMVKNAADGGTFGNSTMEYAGDK